MKQDVVHARTQFGAHVAGLRHERKLTLVELATAIQVTHPAVVAVEKGRRAVGDNLAMRLAEALEIQGEAREKFLLMAASTRIKQRLVGSANQAPPTLTHFLVNLLQQQGVAMNQIHQAQMTQAPSSGDRERGHIQQQFERGSAEYEKSLAGLQLSRLPLLELNLENGRKAFCAMLWATT